MNKLTTNQNNNFYSTSTLKNTSSNSLFMHSRNSLEQNDNKDNVKLIAYESKKDATKKLIIDDIIPIEVRQVQVKMSKEKKNKVLEHAR